LCAKNHRCVGGRGKIGPRLRSQQVLGNRSSLFGVELLTASKQHHDLSNGLLPDERLQSFVVPKLRRDCNGIWSKCFETSNVWSESARWYVAFPRIRGTYRRVLCFLQQLLEDCRSVFATRSCQRQRRASSQLRDLMQEIFAVRRNLVGSYF